MMLSLGLSVNSGIKLLERSLRFRVISFNRMMHEAIHSLTPTAKVTQSKAVVAVESKTNGPKIARTAMPDQRMDFNHTFQHIRRELDGYYKERNPMFSNTIPTDSQQHYNTRYN